MFLKTAMNSSSMDPIGTKMNLSLKYVKKEPTVNGVVITESVRANTMYGAGMSKDKISGASSQFL